jgi:hypothetical protein
VPLLLLGLKVRPKSLWVKVVTACPSAEVAHRGVESAQRVTDLLEPTGMLAVGRAACNLPGVGVEAALACAKKIWRSPPTVALPAISLATW